MASDRDRGSDRNNGNDRGRVNRASTGSKFEYKTRSADKVKARAADTGRRYETIFKSGFDTFRPKEGSNYLRILPPTWPDNEHYSYDVWCHKRVGPDSGTYMCPRKMLQKPCPMCEAADQAEREASKLSAKDREEEMKEVYKIRAQHDNVMWILDRDAKERPDHPRLFQISHSQDVTILGMTVNDRTGGVLAIDHPEDGYDLVFKRQGKGMTTKYQGHVIEREPSTILDDPKKQQDVLDYITQNPIPDTLKYFEYDHLRKVITGTIVEKDEDADDTSDDDEDENASSRDDTRTRHTRDAENEDREVSTERTRNRRPDPVDEPKEDRRAQRRPRNDDDGGGPADDNDPPPRETRGRPTSRDTEEREERPASSRRQPERDAKPSNPDLADDDVEEESAEDEEVVEDRRNRRGRR